MLGTRPDLWSISWHNTQAIRQRSIDRCEKSPKGTAYTELDLGKRGIPASMQNKYLLGYFDAAYMDDATDRHSAMGYIFFYHNCANSCASKKQQTIAPSDYRGGAPGGYRSYEGVHVDPRFLE